MHMTRRGIAIGILLLLAAAPALAVGPNDGVYAVVENLARIADAPRDAGDPAERDRDRRVLLYPEGFWVFGFSLLSESNHIEGNLTQTDGGATTASSA